MIESWKPWDLCDLLVIAPSHFFCSNAQSCLHVVAPPVADREDFAANCTLRKMPDTTLPCLFQEERRSRRAGPQQSGGL